MQLTVRHPTFIPNYEENVVIKIPDNTVISNLWLLSQTFTDFGNYTFRDDQFRPMSMGQFWNPEEGNVRPWEPLPNNGTEDVTVDINM
jgi:hypothetical protein